MKRIICALAFTMCLINAGCQTGEIAVESVTLNATSISLVEGESAVLSAIISPSYATNQKVLWTIDNSAVATVESGMVKAISIGKAMVTAASEDGGKTATCEVFVTLPAPPAVDMGLSVKWASCNIGASKPEEYGGYYQWAGLQDVTGTGIYLYWDNCPYHTGSTSSTGWTKYITSEFPSYWSGPGNPDDKIVLDPEDDVAHVTFGGKWRMPTAEEWLELDDNCSRQWTTLNGVTGEKMISKKNGNSIFLPAAGFTRFDQECDVGSQSTCWSSTLYLNSPYNAVNHSRKQNLLSISSRNRYYAQPVRPVSE